MIDWAKYKGKRLLVSNVSDNDNHPFEIKVLDISSHSYFVKILYLTGNFLGQDHWLEYKEERFKLLDSVD